MKTVVHCRVCKGTGEDVEKTKRAAALGSGRLVHCWCCGGKGYVEKALAVGSKAAIIREVIPSFCFVTTSEIVAMAEQVREDIDIWDVSAAVSKLTAQGKVIRRRAHGDWRLEFRKNDKD